MRLADTSTAGVNAGPLGAIDDRPGGGTFAEGERARSTPAICSGRVGTTGANSGPPPLLLPALFHGASGAGDDGCGLRTDDCELLSGRKPWGGPGTAGVADVTKSSLNVITSRVSGGWACVSPAIVWPSRVERATRRYVRRGCSPRM